MVYSVYAAGDRGKGVLAARSQAAGILACHFFTVETLLLKTYYVLFFIELKTRRVHIAGATTNPNSAWVTQQARNVSGHLGELGATPRFLICDRDTKFTASFDAVFEADGTRIISTPSGPPTRTRTPNGG